MKEKLENIILELLKNKESLEREIENSISDNDYLGAHYNSIALKKVNRKLQTFQNLKNPNFDKIASKERQIKIYEIRIDKEVDENMKKYFQSKIDKLYLEKLKLENTTFENKDKSYNLMWKLLELHKGIISKLHLILNERNSVSIDFIKRDRSLIISIREESFKMLTFGDEYRIVMKNLGFIKLDDVFTLEIDDFNELKINNILEINSLIIFEIFYFKNLDKPMKLIYD